LNAHLTLPESCRHHSTNAKIFYLRILSESTVLIACTMPLSCWTGPGPEEFEVVRPTEISIHNFDPKRRDATALSRKAWSAFLATSREARKTPPGASMLFPSFRFCLPEQSTQSEIVSSFFPRSSLCHEETNSSLVPGQWFAVDRRYLARI
jgi:hypothetical protein